MHKISRIYVANCGVKMSWFDGLMFDLRSVESGEPTDTIVNLENGGGKTVLLSLIFSCFETRADRFLKHLHEAKNRITQYFADDGTPGIIAVEWYRDDGAADDAVIVTGQIAANKAIPGSDELDRYFFSFVAQEGLTLDTLPGPKLGNNVARSMPEILRWFEQQKSKKRGLFYSTRLQNDWERHLEIERGIDVGLLKLQLEFSRAEGGVDSGFMTFKTEFDFLKLFFELTLDQERIRNVRDAIGLTCDKLRRKPEFEARVRGLAGLLEGAQKFAEDTKTYDVCQNELRQVQFEAGLAANSLSAQTSSLGQVVQEASLKIDSFNLEIKQKNELLQKCETLANVFHYLKLQKQIEESEQMLATSAADEVETEAQLNYKKAAIKLKEMLSLERALTTLHAKREQVEAGLEDLREPLKKQGTVLFRRYTDLKNTAALDLDRLSSLEHEAAASENQINSQLRHVQDDQAEALGAQGVLTHRINQYKSDIFNLQEAGIIAEDENVFDCRDRWNKQLDQALSQISGGESDLKAAIDIAEKINNDLRQTEIDVIGYKLERNSAQQFLAKAADEKDRLLRHKCMEYVIGEQGSTEINEKISDELESLKLELAGKLSVSSVSVAQLALDRQSIESIGLTQSHRDVAVVVDALKSADIKTARSFASYLAKIMPDADQARRLVVTNPARYLGVCVQTEKELAECNKIKGLNLEIRNPVMISLVEDKPSPPEYAVVIPAQLDSDFNFEAAEALKTELTALEDEQRLFAHELDQGIEDCVLTIQGIKDYLACYTKEAVSDALEKERNLTAAIEQASVDIEAMHRKYGNIEGEIDQLRELLQKLGDEKANAAKSLGLLDQFIKSHDTTVDSLVTSLSQLEETIERLNERTAAINRELGQLHDLQIERARERERIKNQASQFETQLAEIEYFYSEDSSKFCDCLTDETLKEFSTSDLQLAYKRSLALLQQSSKDRLGTLQVQIEESTTTLAREKHNFEREFGVLDRALVEPHIAGDPEHQVAVLQKRLLAIKDQNTELAEKRSMFRTLLSEHSKRSKTGPKSLIILSSVEKELSISRIEERCTLLAEESQQLTFALDTLAEQLAVCRTDKLRVEGLEQQASHLLELVQTIDLDDHLEVDLALFSIEGDYQQLHDRIKGLGNRGKKCSSRSKGLYQAVSQSHNKVQALASAEELTQHEPEISNSIKAASLEQAMRSSEGWASDVEERMRTTQDILDGMKAEFLASVDELVVLADMAIKVLKSAASSKTVPHGVPHVGGKTVLKFKESAVAGGAEAKRQLIEGFLDKLIADARPPGPGAALLAQVMHVIAGGAVHIQFLKMVIDPREQYVPIDKLTNSGGEAVAMAMFLYLVTAQIRAESRYKHKNAASGPLILDNPFAKATNPGIWKAQRALAEAMGTQLILATALPDYNTLGQFERIIRLRRHGQNNRSGRWHLEISDFEFLN